MTLVASNTPVKNYWSPLVVASLAATWFVWGSMYLAIQSALTSFPAFFQWGPNSCWPVCCF